MGHSPPQVGRAQGQEPRSAAPQEAGAGGLVRRGSTGAQRTEEGRDWGGRDWRLCPRPAAVCLEAGRLTSLSLSLWGYWSHLTGMLWNQMRSYGKGLALHRAQSRSAAHIPCSLPWKPAQIWGERDPPGPAHFIRTDTASLETTGSYRYCLLRLAIGVCKVTREKLLPYEQCSEKAQLLLLFYYYYYICHSWM